MNKFNSWLANNATNILATIYIILVQVVAGVLHACKIWTSKDWPVKALKLIDKPAAALRNFCNKNKKVV